ncbi:type II toxin-antitoxin system RelE/ParE family toxin [bacterium]|nr:type II toxin-antitoxin system RelE/ParE family toxin [bacterium]
MNDYRIFETAEFTKSIAKLSPAHNEFLSKKLKEYVYPQLRNEPYWGKNIKKLRGYSPETWRYRIGHLRLFYIIDKGTKIVYILSIDLRKDAY